MIDCQSRTTPSRNLGHTRQRHKRGYSIPPGCPATRSRLYPGEVGQRQVVDCAVEGEVACSIQTRFAVQEDMDEVSSESKLMRSSNKTYIVGDVADAKNAKRQTA